MVRRQCESSSPSSAEPERQEADLLRPLLCIALPSPFEQDTSIIRDREIASGKTGACGRTKVAGSLDVAAESAKGELGSVFFSRQSLTISPSSSSTAMAVGIHTAAVDGTLQMTIHQV